MKLMESVIVALMMSLHGGVAHAERFQSSFSFYEPVQPPRKTKVISHRGAEFQAPANTIRGVEFSLADSVEWVELDVRRTKDGHHVLFHDEILDGTTTGSGKLRDHTLAELEKVDVGTPFAPRFAGEKIPRLEQAFAVARGTINLKLNCLDVDAARLASQVIDAKMEKQVMITARREDLEVIHQATAGKLALVPRWNRSEGFNSWINRLSPAAVHIKTDDFTSEVAQEFHRRGIGIVVVTSGSLDRDEVWSRVLRDGADWILTDLAEELLVMMSLRNITTMPIELAIHRGAGRYAPENTIPAFEKALRLGADYVEFDVRTSHDKGLFLLHDAGLDRTTTGKGPISETDRATVESLDAGSWFAPTFKGTRVLGLEEFLHEFGPRTKLYFDAKEIPPKALAEAIQTKGLAERTVVYQGQDYLARLRTIAPEIRRMPPLREKKELERMVERVDPYAVDMRWSLLSEEIIAACHARKIKVFSDAIGANETIEGYQRAIRQGIDVIQTDHPVRVLRAIELIQ